MSAAVRDAYGTPTLLGCNNNNPVTIKATESGNLHVTDNKKLLAVIKLPLSEARVNQIIYDYPFNEITINILDSPVEINFTDDLNKKLTIVRPMSITTSADRLTISNSANTGNIELWLWG